MGSIIGVTDVTSGSEGSIDNSVEFVAWSGGNMTVPAIGAIGVVQ
jgi:hypothetical protein